MLHNKEKKKECMTPWCSTLVHIREAHFYSLNIASCKIAAVTRRLLMAARPKRGFVLERRIQMGVHSAVLFKLIINMFIIKRRSNQGIVFHLLTSPESKDSYPFAVNLASNERKAKESK